jgi:amino acid adenylation domain-containing protein
MNLPFVHEWFAANAAARPQATAIDAGVRTVTYGELERRSNARARTIAATVPRCTLIGLLTDDMVQVITAMIATLKAGCAFVPMDRTNSDGRLATLIDEIDLQWWVADENVVARIARLGRQRERSFKVLCTTPAAATDDSGADVVPVGTDSDCSPFAILREPDSLCYIYFTSGSTGRPKGIAGRLKAIDHFIRWEAKAIGSTAGIRFSQLISPAFDAVLRDVFTPLCTGGIVCVPADSEIKQHAFRLFEWLRDAQVNVVHCVPSVLRTLLQIPADECRLPALAHVLTSGEALLPTDVQRWLPRFGGHARLTNLYGPSETTMVKFAYVVSAADADRPSVSIGTPIDGTRAIVVNEHGKVCPPGAIGEIYIRTPYRSLGYYGRPELTADVFVPNPFGTDPTDLVYRTGDLGRLMKDGSYEFLGRRDTQVKIRGMRVELAEIENALRRDPRVRDSSVIDRALEDGSKTLCAFVVLQDGLTIEVVKSGVADVLPDYMVPSTFFAVDALPRTVSGKVERSVLEAMLSARPSGPAVFAAPRTPIEELVASTWARALSVERIGIHDD